MSALSLEGIACARGGRLLFEGLCLSLEAGEAALVTGPNGAGKTSLLRLIAGLIEPERGRCVIEGAIAFAGEELALDPRQSVGAALGFWAKIDRRPAHAVKDALDATGLGHLSDVPVRILSTGQRKRAVLTRTLLSGARVWLLDEPANGLDAAACDRLGAIMAEHRAGGGIIVAASHLPLDLPDAKQVVLGQ